MAKADQAITATRSPRGTKPVSQAFFTALDAIPAASQAAVAKAALAMIRDEIKMAREKTKAAAAKVRASNPATANPVKKAAAKKIAQVAETLPQPAPAPVKRRSKKPVELPVAV